MVCLSIYKCNICTEDLVQSVTCVTNYVMKYYFSNRLKGVQENQLCVVKEFPELCVNALHHNFPVYVITSVQPL